MAPRKTPPPLGHAPNDRFEARASLRGVSAASRLLKGIAAFMITLSTVGTGVNMVYSVNQNAKLEAQEKKIAEQDAEIKRQAADVSLCKTHLGMLAASLDANTATTRAYMPLIRPYEVRKQVEESVRRLEDNARMVRELLKKQNSQGGLEAQEPFPTMPSIFPHSFKAND